jgi:melibiase-like protein
VQGESASRARWPNLKGEALGGPARSFSRRTLLRWWVGGATLGLLLGSRGPDSAEARASLTAAGQSTSLVAVSEAAQLEYQFDGTSGGFGLVSLNAFGTNWAGGDARAAPALRIRNVQVEGQAPISIDGTDGLELRHRSETELTLRHGSSGLEIKIEAEPRPGNAFAHRLTLTNGRPEGAIWIGSAATLLLPLTRGELTEAVGADDSPDSWTTVRHGLPASWGNHELRNADRGVYPLIRLATSSGLGWIVAVSTATSWRVDVALEGGQRVLEAGEYLTDWSLQPGEAIQLPEVLTIAYRDGLNGAVSSLRRYLESVSARPPANWPATPPVVFNTWFGYGCAVGDDGTPDSHLRSVARRAAAAGAEVLVVDAGWYLGNPVVPVPSPDRRAHRSGVAPPEEERQDEPDRTNNVSPWRLSSSGSGQGTGGTGPVPARQDRPDGGARSDLPPEDAVDHFDIGLGTWVESPSKWLAAAGTGGSPHAGLRNFSDFVHSLDVLDSNGAPLGKMRFGLWFEPDRFDPDFAGPERVPGDWAMAGAPILDLTRAEVVEGLTGRIQWAIDQYRLDYVKLDANLGVGAEPRYGRSGHFWTRWSAGYEQFYRNLREANPSLHIEHCAAGLKRFWIGLPRLAHATWLDDDVEVTNVGTLLDVTDGLMLPRHKTVLVTEDLGRYVEDEVDADGVATGNDAGAEVRAVIRAYWGGDRRNGGTIGFSDQIETWGDEQHRAAALAIERWKREVRG